MRILCCAASVFLSVWSLGLPAHGQSSAPPKSTTSEPAPEGLTTHDWSSIRAAYEAGRHAAFAVDDGHRARNPGQQWTTLFDGRGFTTTPDAGGWTWGLELTTWGAPGAERAVEAAPTVTANGQHVAYAWDDQLTEWYVNDQRGLEHGYTVHARPAGVTGELTLSLAIRGELLPDVADDGRAVRFVDGASAMVLTYSGLSVFDASGERLPARFELRGVHLSLTINEGEADYPLTIDPVAQQAYLKASNTGGVNLLFGSSVAVSGDTVVVGAYLEDSNATGVGGDQSNNGAQDAGAAYVFVRSGTNWSQQAYLKASNTDAFDEFGKTVAVSGDTIVVGAWGEDSNATGVNGDQSDNSAPSAGAAYVFVRSGTSWSQKAYLKASNTQFHDGFGVPVSVADGTVVVAARGESSNATGVNGDQSNNNALASGAVYVFAPSGLTWIQQGYLKASNTQALDSFGASVAISGDTIVVGAIGENSNATGVNGDQGNNGAVDAGAAYVFVRNFGRWFPQAYLKASNTGAADTFGYSAAISGDTIVVGALFEDSSATGVDGDGSNNSALGAGAAYVFVRSETSWSQQAYLKASNNAETDDYFGHSVAISGDTVVVGASHEDSSATGIDGDGSNNGAPSSGAAYVFARDATSWSPQAYLKASNAGGADEFGHSVAISGDTVVVGAWREDSGATGVDGDGTDNGATNAGAAYVVDLDILPEPWLDLGSGLAGVSGVPVLVGTGTLIGGDHVSLALSNANPSSSAALVIGLSLLNAAFKGGTLVPMPDIIVDGLPIDGSGVLVINAIWPTGIPSGSHFWVQEWITDPAGPQGFSASNGLRGTTP